MEISNNLGTGHPKHGPDDPALRRLDDRRDPAQPLSPGAAKQLHQYRLCLIVARMGSRNRVYDARFEKLMENAITQRPRCFFNALAPLGGERGNIAALHMQRGVEPRRKLCDELRITIRRRAAQSMMEMDRRQHDAGDGA